MWTLASFHHIPPSVSEVFVPELIRRTGREQFNAQQLCNLLWSQAIMQVSAPRVSLMPIKHALANQLGVCTCKGLHFSSIRPYKHCWCQSGSHCSTTDARCTCSPDQACRRFHCDSGLPVNLRWPSNIWDLHYPVKLCTAPPSAICSSSALKAQ